MKRIDFEGTTHEFPDDFSDDDISAALGGGPPKDTRSNVTRFYQDYLAKPLTKAVSPLADAVTEPLVAAARVAQGEPVAQVGSSYLPKSLGDVLKMTPVGKVAGGFLDPKPTNPLATAAVPQTPLEAGMMAGTMGAGPLAKQAPSVIAALAKAHPALTRIFGGAVGGEVGNQLEGGTTGKGALVGGAGAAGGEILGAGAARARLALPGGKRAANEADAARIGQTVEDLVPELAGVRTTPQIRAMTEGGGQAALGQAKEGTTRAIEGALGANVPGGGRRIDVPALGPREGTGTGPAAFGGTGPSRVVYQTEGGTPAFGGSGPGRAQYDYAGRPTTPTPYEPATGGSIGSPTGMTPYSPAVGGNPPVTTRGLREANEGLTSVGEGQFNQNILDRGAKKAADRRLYGRVSREIGEGLEGAAGPEARGAFESGQDAYSSGIKLLDFFKRSRVVDNDGFLNVPRLQQMLNDPKQAATLRHALGPDDFARFSDSVYRGAPRGETDRMTPGQGGPFDALMSLLRRQNTGSGNVVNVFSGVGELLPNVGSKYVGQNPLSIPDLLRSILGVGAQRGGLAAVDQP